MLAVTCATQGTTAESALRPVAFWRHGGVLSRVDDPWSHTALAVGCTWVGRVVMSGDEAPAISVAPRVYLWIWGPMLVALGVGSLIINPDFGVGEHVTEKHLFGVFETNGWHGLAGGSAGVAAVFSAWSQRRIREVALGVAVLGGIVPAVIFLVSGDDSAALGLIPVDLADTISLHLLPGLVGLASVAAGVIRGSATGPRGTAQTRHRHR